MARWYPVLERLGPMIEAPDRQAAARLANAKYGRDCVRVESAASLESDGRTPERFER